MKKRTNKLSGHYCFAPKIRRSRQTRTAGQSITIVGRAYWILDRAVFISGVYGLAHIIISTIS